MLPSFQFENNSSKEKKDKNKAAFPKGRLVLPAAREEIEELLKDRPINREFLIEYLHIIQDKYNQLPVALLAALAEKMHLSQAEVYEVASFYHHFRVNKAADVPLPELTVRVCNGITCEMSGANDL